MKIALNRNKNILFFSAAAITLAVLLADVLWLAVLILLFAAGILFFKKRFFLLFSFASLVTVTGAFGSGTRLLIQLVNISLLLYYFITEYGTDYKRYPVIPIPVIILVIMVLFSILVSSLMSEYTALGIEQFFRTIIFFLIIYLFYSLLQSAEDIKIYLSAFFITAAIIFSFILYYFYLSGFDLLSFNQTLLLMGTESLVNKNGFGSFLVITISVLISYLLYLKNNRRKALIFFVILILLSGLIITNSRGALFSLFFSTAVILFLLNKKILLGLLVILLLFIPLLFIEPINSFVELYFRFDRISAGRDFILESTYNVIKNNLVFGAGPAAAKYEIYNNLPFMIGSGEELFLAKYIDHVQFGHAHNFYLFFFSDMGIPGFLTSLLLPAVFLFTGIKTFKSPGVKRDGFFYLSAGIFGAGIALFIRGLFEWAGLMSYGYLSADLPFWWIFIIMIYLYMKGRRSFSYSQV